MTLLESLLDAIIRLDGEALVMHVGEKPYVVLNSTSINKFRGPLAWGQVELSSRALTGEAVVGMLGQILSPAQRNALDEFGAIEEEIDAPDGTGQRFIVTAARGGEDIWVEVRRRNTAIPVPAIVDDEAPAAAIAPAPAISQSGVEAGDPSSALPQPEPAAQEGPHPLPVAAEAGRSDAEIAAQAEALLAEKIAAVAAEAEAALAATKAALAAEAEAALAAKMAALTAEAESTLAAREAALAAAAEAALAAKESDLDARVAEAVAAKVAALTSEAEAALAAKHAALAAQAEAALAAREAALAAQTQAALAAEAQRVLEAKTAALAAEAERAMAAKEAELAAGAQRLIAEREAALAADAERVFAERQAALAADAERIFDEREAALAAEADRLLAEREAALAAETQRILAEREAALAAKEASMAAEAERRLAARIAEAEAALAAQQTAAEAEAERVLAARIAAAEAAMARREAALAAETERTLAARAADADAASMSREAALAAEAARMLAEREAALAADAARMLAEREAALAADAARVLAEREAALAADAARVLAEREATLAADAARVLAEREATLAADASRVLAEREAALAAEAARVLGEREAAVAAEAARILAEQEAGVAAEAARLLAEREAALAAEAARVLADREAALAVEAARILAEQGAVVAAEAARVQAEREAALAVEAERARLAGETAAAAEREAALLAEATLAAEVEAERIAQEQSALAAEAEAEMARSVARTDAEFARGAEADASLSGSPVVRSIARPLKLQPPQPSVPAAAASTQASLVELLRAAVGHRASTVYALVDARPMMRVDGQIALVGIQATIVSGDVERFIYEFAPRDLVANAAPEWTCVVPGVGRVRCVTFHDQSGAGLIFHLPSAEASTADEVELGPELQALCAGADGLIVVAGPRSSGKSALLSAFVDVINSTRCDHIITIESQIRRVHEKRLSFISQREVRGDGDAIGTAARTALREGPDVLVIEDLRAPEALVAALDAARAGRLVFGSISAPTAPGAIERLIDAFPADRRPQVRASLAGALRAVVAQILVPKVAGGRIAAREVLLSSPAVRKLVLDGATSQLPIAIESGRSLGMKTMVDSLGALVREGIVDIRTACACAPDRDALILALVRDGIDVSGVEKRA